MELRKGEVRDKCLELQSECWDKEKGHLCLPLGCGLAGYQRALNQAVFTKLGLEPQDIWSVMSSMIRGVAGRLAEACGRNPIPCLVGGAQEALDLTGSALSRLPERFPLGV
jgi:hypothetical protein